MEPQNQPGSMNTSPVTSPNNPVGQPAGQYRNTSPANLSDNGHKKVGPIIATLVIVLILIIAALYLFASRINQQSVPTDTTTADSTSANSIAAATQSVQPVTGTADDPTALQSDLNASTKGLDSQNF
jgi:hypothetical protein